MQCSHLRDGLSSPLYVQSHEETGKQLQDDVYENAMGAHGRPPGSGLVRGAVESDRREGNV